MNTIAKRTVTLVVLAVMIMCLLPFVFGEKSYAAVKLSKKSIVIGKGQTAKLKVKGTKKKVKWSSTKKSIATVSKKGVVKGKKIGSCYIKAKVGGKTLKCKVAVKKPEVANAMNLRKYILANGKKASDGGYYIQKKWQDELVSEDYVGFVEAYKDRTEMYFEYKENAFDDDYFGYKLTIDLIKQKPGSAETVYGILSSDSDDTYYGTIDCSFHYEGSDAADWRGAELTKITYTEYDYSTGSTTHTDYTDPSDLNDPYTLRNFYAYTVKAFGNFDTLFKKCKLKSRMKNLGFSDL